MAEVLAADVLVVGGGGAAARAAFEAHRAGAKVVLAVKGRFGALGTRGAGATAGSNSERGGFRARGVPRLGTVEPDKVFADIMQAGLGTADRKLAHILADEATASRIFLEELGVKWNVGFGIKSHGVPIMIALENAIRHTDIVLKERTMVTNLLMKDGACVGAVAVDEDGVIWVIKARAVMLGTGGNGNLFMFNMDPPCVTGDGYAMGYEVGAELMNLEFSQIFLGSVYPTINLLGHWAFEHMGRVTNKYGHPFIADYLPSGGSLEECIEQKLRHNPFSTRDSLSRYLDVGMIKETKAGRANEHNGFYLDLTDPKIPLTDEVLDFYWYRGINLRREPVQLNTCQQCSNGGFRVDENSQTTIPGLYAAGEAATGYHGADRLGGNMLAVSQVFGARAGKHAAQVAREKGPAEPDADQARYFEECLEAVRKRSGFMKPAAVTVHLQRQAWEDLLVVRSAEGLTRFIRTVRRIQNEMEPHVYVETPFELQQALELHNLLTNGEIVARAALFRTESRGGHYREDYPTQDNANWLKVVSVKQVSGQMTTNAWIIDPEWKDREGDMGAQRWG